MAGNYDPVHDIALGLAAAMQTSASHPRILSDPLLRIASRLGFDHRSDPARIEAALRAVIGWGGIPEGHEVAVAEEGPDWRPDDTGSRCSYVIGQGRPGIRRQCDMVAAAAVRRGIKRPAWWRYCPEHMQGRWIEDGKVMCWVLRKSEGSAGA